MVHAPAGTVREGDLCDRAEAAAANVANNVAGALTEGRRGSMCFLFHDRILTTIVAAILAEKYGMDVEEDLVITGTGRAFVRVYLGVD